MLEKERKNASSVSSWGVLQDDEYEDRLVLRRPDAASSLVQNYLRNKQQYKLYQKPIHYFAIIPVPFRNRYLFFPIF